MLEAITQSITYLCQDILGEDLEYGKSLGKELYGSSIGLVCNGKESYYYLFLKKDTINEFGKGFLGEDDLHEDDLNDLCKEIANLTVGKAKAFLDDAHPKNSYKLGTPEYLGRISPPLPIKLDDFTIFKLKNRTFLLGVKKSNG